MSRFYKFRKFSRAKSVKISKIIDIEIYSINNKII